MPLKSDPVSTMIVIDKSGSMDGEGKIKFAIEGAKTMVDLLTENDTVGIVVFDGHAETLFDIDYATKENKVCDC
jgi:Mg-chelatase subunit ChlD